MNVCTRAVVVLAVAVLLGDLGNVVPATADATPTVAVPATAAPERPPAPRTHGLVLDLAGRGFGHGYGLSQWGAYGYAVDVGWTADQIVGHYYAGTVAGVVPVDNVTSVRLTALDDQQTAVVSRDGRLRVDTVAGGPWKSVLIREVSDRVYRVWARTDAEVCPATSGDPVTSGWTLVASSLSTQVDVRTEIDPYAVSTTFAQLPAVCEPTTGRVRSYRGTIRAANGTVGENRTVNLVRTEQYLRAVVAKEMSPGWATAGGGRGVEALKAQAIAARSYVFIQNRYSYARTCDSTACQAYYGAAVRSSTGGSFTSIEHPATDGAVAAVAGVVRRVGTVDGAVANTMYAASSGGITRPGVGALMPFPSVVDEGDATSLNPNHTWTTSLTEAQLATSFGFASVDNVTITGRTDGLTYEAGGRVAGIRVDGRFANGTVTYWTGTGDAFRSRFGLKSSWFEIVSVGTPVDPCGERAQPAVTGALPAAVPSTFVAAAPSRVIDTRNGTGVSAGRLQPNCVLAMAPPVPAGATSVVVNLTAVAPSSNGHVTAWPCGTERPTISGPQALATRAVATTSIIRLGADRRICITASVEVDIVADLFGWYSSTEGVRYQPMARTLRLFDTRSGSRVAAGTVTRIAAVRSGGAPAGATAAAVTIHATSPAGAGHLIAYPCTATRPTTSILNMVAGVDITNHAQLALSGSGELCIVSTVATHLIVDMSGWFGATGTSRFVAVTPYRAVDTRSNVGLTGRFSAGQNRAVTLAPSGSVPGASLVTALVGNVTVVAPSAAGYVTVHPCQSPVPSVSMLRYPASTNVAVLVVGPDDTAGRWCLFSSAATHMLVDVAGYFAV